MNNIIDINKYILSRDVKRYIARRNIELDLNDIVNIMYYSSHISFDIQKKDYELILKDYETKDAEYKSKYSNVIDFINAYLEAALISKEEFYDNKDSIYEYRIIYENERPYESDEKFATAKECIKDAFDYNGEQEFIRLSIYKYSLKDHKYVAKGIFNSSYEVLEIEKYFKPYPKEFGINVDISKIYPFNQGDIVIDVSKPVKDRKPILIIEEEKDKAFPSMCSVSENGELNTHNGIGYITNYETYRGEYGSDELKLLLLISDFLRGVISIEAFIDHISLFVVSALIQKRKEYFSPSHVFSSEIDSLKVPVWVREEKVLEADHEKEYLGYPWLKPIAKLDIEEVNKTYSYKIVHNVLTNYKQDELVFIHDLNREDIYYDISLPSDNEYSNNPFYLIYEGEEGKRVKEVVNKLLDSNQEDKPFIKLFKKFVDKYMFTTYCHISKSLINDQEKLRSLLSNTVDINKDAFIVPLVRYKYVCPVCGKRTLPNRGMFDICEECGWEDDEFDECPDVESPPNGCSFNRYKKDYLKKRIKEEMK